MKMLRIRDWMLNPKWDVYLNSPKYMHKTQTGWSSLRKKKECKSWKMKRSSVDCVFWIWLCSCSMKSQHLEWCAQEPHKISTTVKTLAQVGEVLSRPHPLLRSCWQLTNARKGAPLVFENMAADKMDSSGGSKPMCILIALTGLSGL